MNSEFPICWTDVTFENFYLKTSHESSVKLNCQNVDSLASTGGMQAGFIPSAHELLM